MKTALVFDSTFYMDHEKFENGNFNVLPLTVNFDDTLYKEINDNGEQIEEVFKKIYKAKKVPTTSQPATSEAIDMFEKLIALGYEKIVSLHISSGLSGTAQGVTVAAQQVCESHPDIKISVFDTLLTAQPATIVAEEVLAIINEEGTISDEEVQAIIDFYNANMKIHFLVDDLDFLAFGGRIPATVASIGNLFGIQPLLTLDKGKIEKTHMVRSPKKALQIILDDFNDTDLSKSDEVVMRSVHVQNEKAASKLMKTCQKARDLNYVDNEVSSLGIVIGNHVGPKMFGIVWSKKYKRPQVN